MVDGQEVYFKSSEIMDEVKTESVQLIVTSPPYWDIKEYGGIGIGFGQLYDDYINSMNKIWKECLRVLKPNGKIAINFQPLPIAAEKSGFGMRSIKNIMFDVEAFMRQNGMFLSSMHYWDKAKYINTVYWGSYPNPTNIGSNTSFEQIFVWVKPGTTRKIPKEVLENNLLKKEEWRHWAVRCIWDDISPILKIDSTGKNRFGHAAPFPEDIPYRMIRMHTVEEELVLDPFLGSGTTLKISRLLKRRGIGYEINPKYRDLIASRIAESWIPPSIESQYIVIGNDTFSEIFSFIVDNAMDESTGFRHAVDKNLLLQLKVKVLKSLGKQFFPFLSKSYLEKVQSRIIHEKKRKEKTLFDFMS
jgi:DNA modification methylase